MYKRYYVVRSNYGHLYIVQELNKGDLVLFSTDSYHEAKETLLTCAIDISVLSKYIDRGIYYA